MQSREAFERTNTSDLAGERAVVTFAEAAHLALYDLGGDEFSNRYFNLLAGFIEKFSLRYDLRRPGTLCPTLPGMFASLGAICNQIGTWPHEKVKEAMKDLYNFTSDYPGIRHGGTPANALRAVDMRNMVAMSILLAGFTPYVSNGLDADVVYRGS